MYWRHLWEVHVAHSALSINLSISDLTVRATSLSPWCYCQENNMDSMKNFWVHWILGSVHSVTDTKFRTLCCMAARAGKQWQWRLEKGRATSVDAPWAASGKDWSLKLKFLCSMRGGRDNFHFSSHCEGQIKDWKDGVVGVVVGNVACWWLVGFRRWDFRRNLEVWDVKKSTKKGRENNLFCSPCTLCQVKRHNDAFRKVRTV